MCLYDDGDTYGFVSMGNGVRRARVEHKCLECNRTIEPGENYRYWTAIDTEAGGWMTSKMCAHCWGTIDLGAELTGCHRYWYWDYVHDLDVEMGFVGNCLGDEGHDLGQPDRYRLLRTVVGRRQQWRTRSGDLLPVPALSNGRAETTEIVAQNGRDANSLRSVETPDENGGDSA